MRLLERLKREFTVKPAAVQSVYEENDRLYRFDESRAFVIRAAIQPLAEKTVSAVYGETPKAELTMLYDGGETLDEGMGVCVDVQEDAPCDYVISEMPRRYQSHKEVTLTFITPERRG